MSTEPFSMKKAVEPYSPSRQITSPLRKSRRLTAWMLDRKKRERHPLKRLANLGDLVLEKIVDRDVAAGGKLGLDDAPVGQGAGRAVVRAFAAGHAARAAHRHVEIERDPRCVTLAHAADDVVFLDDVAAPDAAIAENAGVVVDGDDQR